MKRFAVALTAAAGMLCSIGPAQSHTALGKKYEAEFYAWTSCNENAIGLENTLSCRFPMQGSDHLDAMTVYCEDTTITPHWDKEWMKKWGNTPFGEVPAYAFVTIPAFTVEYYSHHVQSKKGFVFVKRGPYSPWANECRRIFPDLDQ